MPGGSRLSAFFDKNLRHSKSASNLGYDEPITQFLTPTQDQAAWRKSSRQPLSITHEDKFPARNPLSLWTRQPPLPLKQREQERPYVIATRRSSTPPVMHPPDELFLKIIHRRSASARLEEQRIEAEQQEYDRSYKHYRAPEPMPVNVAIASALPPIYFDQPPMYTSPDEDIRSHIYPYRQSWSRITNPREDEWLIDESLKVQIDDTIAHYARFQLTQPTPIASSEEACSLVSPLNELDELYLARRKERKRLEKMAASR